MPMDTQAPQQSHKNNLDLIIPTIVILVVLVGLIYWFFLREKTTPPPPQENELEKIIESLSTPEPVANPEFDPKIIEELSEQ